MDEDKFMENNQGKERVSLSLDNVRKSIKGEDGKK